MNAYATTNAADELMILKGSRTMANLIMSTLESRFQEALGAAQRRTFDSRNLTFEEFVTTGFHRLELEEIKREVELDGMALLSAIAGSRSLIDPMMKSQHGLELRSELVDDAVDFGGPAKWAVSFHRPKEPASRFLRLRR